MDQNPQPYKKRALAFTENTSQQAYLKTTPLQVISENGVYYQCIQITDGKPSIQQDPKPSLSQTIPVKPQQKLQKVQPVIPTRRKRDAPSLITPTVAAQRISSTMTVSPTPRRYPPSTRSTQTGSYPSPITPPRSSIIQEPIQPYPMECLRSTNQSEPPMTLEAWSQTNSNDFNLEPNDMPYVMDQIRGLKSQLKVNLEMFSKLRKQGQEELDISTTNTTRSSSPSSPSRSPQCTSYRILTDSTKAKEDEIVIQFCDETASDISPQSDIDIQSRRSVLSDEDQILANVEAEANANNEVDLPEQAETRAVPVPHTRVDDRISKIIRDITKKIEASGDDGINPICYDPDEPLIEIGPNGTKVRVEDFEKLNWSSASAATRKLLLLLFRRETLATHSMTGKPSPAFKDQDRPVKRQLNQQIVDDIVSIVSTRCNVSEREVRNIITTKCADENKMLKLRESRLMTVAFEHIHALKALGISKDEK